MKHRFAGVAVFIALLGAVDAQAGPGDPLGPPFLVSPSSGFTPPQVAGDAAGNFLLLWANQARRSYADGTPQGAEFPILPGDLRYVHEPTVAMGAAGDYVLARRAHVPAENLVHVCARSYDASGITALGNTVLSMRRYAADGKPAGLKTRVNPLFALEAHNPAVAMDHTGGYLIGWQVRHFTSGLDSSGHDVWARRYFAAGKAQGDAFQVNADGEVSVYDRVGVALDPDGDAAIVRGAWWDRTNIQRYSAAGLPQGGKTLVSTPGVRITSAPAVALDAYGNAVVA